MVAGFRRYSFQQLNDLVLLLPNFFIVSLGPWRGRVFQIFKPPPEEIVIFGMERAQAIERQIPRMGEGIHLLPELVKFITPGPEKRQQAGTPEDYRTVAVEFLGQQSVNHFIRNLQQGYICFDNAMVNPIQFLETGEDKKGDQDGQESVKKISEEHFLGDVKSKKAGCYRLHVKPKCE
jgi:hypothetical protein